jgi:hypothetical protein
MKRMRLAGLLQLVCIYAGFGCAADSAIGPADLVEERWATKEQRRLKDWRKNCGGKPWERVGNVCPDDLVLPERSVSR